MKRNHFLERAVWGCLAIVIAGIVVAVLIQERPSLLSRGALVGGDSEQLPVIKPLGDFVLTNQVAQPVTLAGLAGEPFVANIFFTRCPSICVQMTHKMKELQDALPPESSLRLLSITTDPDYDQPEILSRYGKRFGADAERWSFLTGDPWEIARVIQKELLLAVRENPEAERQSELDLFTHSSLIVLVDAQGRLRNTYESMGTNTLQTLLQDLNRLESSN